MRGHGALAVMLLSLAADQGSKFWVEMSLPFQQPVPVLPFLDFFRTYNTGIAFSLFSRFPDWSLIAFTTFVIAVVAWLWLRLEAGRPFAAFGFALVIGGASGNLIDRLAFGHVVDFILVHAGGWSFAVFNLADSFITIGAGLILVDEFFAMARGGRKAAGE